jgi:hypothetical protein
MQIPMTLRNWLLRIPSIIARGTLTLLPLAGTRLETVEKLPLVWPPLGGLETYAAIPAAAIIGAFGIIPAMFKSQKHARLQGYFSLGIALILLIVYGYFFSTRVQGVAIPGDGMKYFTIGTVKTDAAMREFPNASNEQLVEAAGVRGEGDIERAWTASSIKLAELELLISYVCLMASVNYTLGAFARATKTNKPD